MSLRIRPSCGVLCASGIVLLAVLCLSTPASAGAIVTGTYYEFGFEGLGDVATGCDPADPAGAFCVPSGGTPSTFLDAPPWTFTAGATGATLTVLDGFDSGDRFEVFNFGVSLGLTSASGPGTNCGDDPVVCLATPEMSQRAFALAAGAYSITIGVAGGGFGAGYLLLEDGGLTVPEPATLMLLATGAGAALYRRRRQTGLQ